jgi:hypothetical protein
MGNGRSTPLEMIAPKQAASLIEQIALAAPHRRSRTALIEDLGIEYVGGGIFERLDRLRLLGAITVVAGEDLPPGLGGNKEYAIDADFATQLIAHWRDRIERLTAAATALQEQFPDEISPEVQADQSPLRD